MWEKKAKLENGTYVTERQTGNKNSISWNNNNHTGAAYMMCQKPKRIATVGSETLMSQLGAAGEAGRRLQKANEGISKVKDNIQQKPGICRGTGGG